MKKATLVVLRPYQKNAIFDLQNPINGKDNHMFVFSELKKQFEIVNYNLATQDINSIEESEIVIYNDMPSRLPSRRVGQKLFLLAMESVSVAPINFDISRYAYFDKVFTWHDLMIDNSRVFKINYSFLINPIPFLDFNNKKGFLCMVSGNKFSNHKGELYTERFRFLEYIASNNFISFDLFGTDWDVVYKTQSIYCLVKKFHYNKYLRKAWSVFEQFVFLLGLRFLIAKNYSFYRGRLSPKIPVLSNYKFNVCYENDGDTPGYITEKIFDCFFAGTVPVYLGAPNVCDYIPQNTFIDRRLFKNNNDLLEFLKNMPRDEYLSYQRNILNFLNSDAIRIFSSDYVANKIIVEVFASNHCLRKY